jgi:signal peptidase II
MPSSSSVSPPNSAGGTRPWSGLRPALALAAAVLALDLLTKWLILEVVMQPPRVIEVTGFLNLVLVENRGVSFGLFGGQGSWTIWAFSALALAIVVGLLVWLHRRGGVWHTLAVGLICGGALGNVADRLRFGAVVDFVDVHAGSWHWPAFNLADSAITVGVAVLLVHGLFFDAHEGK